ncbi:hypothetical protein [Schleiferilactobacillus perolens]|jgi:dihydroxyacid dehydratase/phosphogluconate dehydratase|uniref:AbrB family transcriptional regulator n=1 Tax=Schleiferilactobacillus perolens DSM 12744 TaxID=1423792 RepID=A0A0R1N114_9LACO|nr:hypothetical protein [Schleiferilactobacillus perolens]KRL13708.1 hypothetical protein FD09_GL001732 [Schleiferilactobacillus perolens DSM 12744]MCI1890606.1 AbrB family transcriptional regulator [Schleiferilactobacillus harbinensis]MCI1912179.1 AbrB family transcriptional regulator [Schleiferilactobacillus harbinensis]MCI2172206.1 AbrB family transcriptional regulator [Schleiferilactobacillus perolens]
MLDSKDLKGEAKLFKAGNSYALRLTKKDKELLHADTNTVFEKTISADGSTITYRKKPTVNPDVLKYLDEYYNEHQDMMDELKSL